MYDSYISTLVWIIEFFLYFEREKKKRVLLESARLKIEQNKRELDGVVQKKKI